jgi:alpha-L-arabinofuranosidase
VRNQQQPAYWRKEVLDKASDLVDVLAINRYKGQWFDNPHDKQVNVAESVTKVQKDMEALIKDCDERDHRLKVAITEWSYWLRCWSWDKTGWEEPDDAQHGLYISGVLNLFSRLGDKMEVANFYHLVNPMGILTRKGTKVIEASVTEIFRLYRPAFPGKYIVLDVSSPCLGEVEPAVDALYMRQNNSDWLFITNRDDAETAEVCLSGFPQSDAEGVMLFAKSPLEPLQKATISMKKNTIVLPPLSIVRFQL